MEKKERDINNLDTSFTTKKDIWKKPGLNSQSTACCDIYLQASRNTNPASGDVITIQSNLVSAAVKKQNSKYSNKVLSL